MRHRGAVTPATRTSRGPAPAAGFGPRLRCRPPQPFHDLPNVLMTPHVSGWTEGLLEARARLIAANIHRVTRGEPPVNEIVPAT